MYMYVDVNKRYIDKGQLSATLALVRWLSGARFLVRGRVGMALVRWLSGARFLVRGRVGMHGDSAVEREAVSQQP